MDFLEKAKPNDHQRRRGRYKLPLIRFAITIKAERHAKSIVD